MSRRLWPALGRPVVQSTKGAIDRRHGAGPNYAFAGVPYQTPLGSVDLDRTVKDAYERDVWVWRAIDARAKNASRLQVQVMDGRGKNAQEIEGHRVSTLLNRKANRYETAQAFRYRLHSLLDLSVTKGVFVEVIEDGYGQPRYLHLLNPLHTWPVPHPETFVSHFFMQLPTGETFDLPVYRRGHGGGVLWIKRPHPTDPYRSTSWLEAANLTVELDYYARLYNRNFLMNDGRPGGVLAVQSEDGIDPADAAVLQQRMSGGPGVAGKVTIMEADALNYIDLATTPRDAQYIEGRAVTQREILVAAGTPLSVIGDASGRTFDNADAEGEGFWRNEMVPELELTGSYWEELTEGGIEDDSEVVTYDYGSVHVLGRDARNEEARAQVEWDKGLITLDEYRERTGKEPKNLPGTRVLWLTSGKAPVGDEKDVTALLTQGMEKPAPAAAEQQALPPGQEQPALPPGPPAPGSREDADQGGSFPDVIDGEVVDGPGDVQAKALRGLDSDYLAARRREHAELIDRHEHAVAEQLLGLFRRQEEVVLARLRGKARKHTRHWTYATPYSGELKALDAAYVIERRRWIESVVEAIAELILTAFGAAGAAAIKQVGSKQTFDPGKAQAEVVARTVRMIAEGFDARAGRLQEIITEADDNGASIDEIAGLVKDAYTSADTWSAVTSREVVGAMNAASLIGAVQAGALRKRWLATDDERTRPTHRDAEGQVVGIGEPFEVGDAELQFPHDPTGPIGETINCLPDGDTPILMASGESKPIRNIRVGHRVVTHRGRARTVKRLSYRRAYAEIIDVQTAGPRLRLTANHPVLTSEGWMVAGELRPGATLLVATSVECGHRGVDLGLAFVSGLGSGAPSASGALRHVEEQARLLPLDDEVRQQLDAQVPCLLRHDLPTVDRVPLGAVFGPGGQVHGPEARHLAAEGDQAGVRVRHDDAGLVVVPGAVLTLAPDAPDRDDALSVNQCGEVGECDGFHARMLPLSVVACSRSTEVTPLWNFAVDEDESYIANGLAVHNCRCTMLYQLGKKSDRQREDELDADLAALDAAEAGGEWKSGVGRIQGGFGRLGSRFEPNRHPRDAQGRFLDVPDVHLPDGTNGVAVAQDAQGNVTVAKADGDVVTVAPADLTAGRAPKPAAPAQPDPAARIAAIEDRQDAIDEQLVTLENEQDALEEDDPRFDELDAQIESLYRESAALDREERRLRGDRPLIVRAPAPKTFDPLTFQAPNETPVRWQLARLPDGRVGQVASNPREDGTVDVLIDGTIVSTDRAALKQASPAVPVPYANTRPDSAERHVWCAEGHRHWGAAGAAGVLIRHTDADGVTRYLMQLRGPHVNQPGTWSTPGGALHVGESPEDGAMREALEEMGVMPDDLTVADVATVAHGGWAYSTVTLDSPTLFTPAPGRHDGEQITARWVTPEEMDELPLHPGFAKTWRGGADAHDVADPAGPADVEIQFRGVPQDTIDVADPELAAEEETALPRVAGFPGFADPDDPARRIPFPDRLGRCYELAGAYAVFPGGTLVHGTLDGDGGGPVQHAWVLRPDGTVFEPTSGHRMTREEFETNLGPTELARYDREAAAASMLRYGHYGPWHAAPDTTAVFSALDERLVNYKPDRNLADPSKTVDLASLLPHAEYVPYSEVPFLAEMHRRMGVEDPLALPVEEYMHRRDELFLDQPIVQVPFDDVVVTQRVVNAERVRQIVEDPATGGTKPQHFVRFQGRTYVMNGHHRVAAQIASGDTSAPGHVLDLDAAGYKGEPAPMIADTLEAAAFLGSYGRAVARAMAGRSDPARRHGRYADHLARIAADPEEQARLAGYQEWRDAQEASVAALFASLDVQPSGGPIAQPDKSGTTGDGAKARTMIPTLLELIDKGMTPEDAKKEWHRLYHNARFRVRGARIKAEKAALAAKEQDLNAHVATALAGTPTLTPIDPWQRPRWAPPGAYDEKRMRQLASADPKPNVHLRLEYTDDNGEPKFGQVLDLPNAAVVSYYVDDSGRRFVRLRVNSSDFAEHTLDAIKSFATVVSSVPVSPNHDVEFMVPAYTVTDVWAMPETIVALTAVEDPLNALEAAYGAQVRLDIEGGYADPGHPDPKALYTLGWTTFQALKKAGLGIGPGAIRPGKTWAQNMKGVTDGVSIPVAGVVIQGRKVEHGTARNIGGMPYLLEHEPTATPDEIEAQFKSMTWAWDKTAKRVVPSMRKHQEGFAWLKGPNPNDVHLSAQKGFAFKSAATGGDGTTTFWNTKPNTDVVSHEFGHNVDSHATHSGNAHTWLSDLPAGVQPVPPADANAGMLDTNVPSWELVRKLDGTHSGYVAAAIGGEEWLKEVRGTHHAIRLGQETGPSDYGMTNEREDFAESVRLYLKDRALGRLGYVNPHDDDGNPLVDPLTGKPPQGVNVRFCDLFPERAAYLDRVFGHSPADVPPTAWQQAQGEALYADLLANYGSEHVSDWPMLNELTEKYGITAVTAGAARDRAFKQVEAEHAAAAAAAEAENDAKAKAAEYAKAAAEAEAALAALEYVELPKVTAGSGVIPKDMLKKIKQNVTWQRWNAKQEKSKVIAAPSAGWGDSIDADRKALAKVTPGMLLKWVDEDAQDRYLRVTDDGADVLSMYGGVLRIRGQQVDEYGDALEVGAPGWDDPGLILDGLNELRHVTQRRHTAEQADAIAKAYEQDAIATALEKAGIATAPGTPVEGVVPPKKVLDEIALGKAKILATAGDVVLTPVPIGKPAFGYQGADFAGTAKGETLEWVTKDGDRFRGTINGTQSYGANTPDAGYAFQVDDVEVWRTTDPDRTNPLPGDVYERAGTVAGGATTGGGTLVVQPNRLAIITYHDTGETLRVAPGKLLDVLDPSNGWQPKPAGERVVLVDTLVQPLARIAEASKVVAPKVSKSDAELKATEYEEKALAEWKLTADQSKQLAAIAKEKARIANDYGPKQTTPVPMPGDTYTSNDIPIGTDEVGEQVWPVIEWEDKQGNRYRGQLADVGGGGGPTLVPETSFEVQGTTTGGAWVAVSGPFPFDKIKPGTLVTVENPGRSAQDAVTAAEAYEAQALADLDASTPKPIPAALLKQIAENKARLLAGHGPGTETLVMGTGIAAKDPNDPTTVLRIPHPAGHTYSGGGPVMVVVHRYAVRDFRPSQFGKGTLIAWETDDAAGTRRRGKVLGRSLKNETVKVQPLDDDGLAVGKPIEVPVADLKPFSVARIAGWKSKEQAKLDAEEYEAQALKLAAGGQGGVSAPTRPEVKGKARTDGHAFIAKAGLTKHPLATHQSGSREQAKANIAAELASRLNNKDDWDIFRAYRIGLSGSLPGTHGSDKYGKVPNDPGAFDDVPPAERQRILDQECSNRVGMWASTSGDSNPWAVMMLRAISEEFDCGGQWAPGDLQNTGWGGQINQDVFDKSWPHARVFYRRFVRTMYEHTQEEFAKQGITEIAGYRGMRNKGTLGWRNALGVQDASVTGTMKPGNSWATDLGIARRFSKNDATGRLVAATVPVSRILGTALTGFGCLAEWEFVVMPGPGQYVIYRYGDVIPST